jgi:hypothetical protein
VELANGVRSWPSSLPPQLLSAVTVKPTYRWRLFFLGSYRTCFPEFVPDVARRIHVRVVLIQRIIDQVAKTGGSGS